VLARLPMTKKQCAFRTRRAPIRPSILRSVGTCRVGNEGSPPAARGHRQPADGSAIARGTHQVGHQDRDHLSGAGAHAPISKSAPFHRKRASRWSRSTCLLGTKSRHEPWQFPARESPSVGEERPASTSSGGSASSGKRIRRRWLPRPATRRRRRQPGRSARRSHRWAPGHPAHPRHTTAQTSLRPRPGPVIALSTAGQTRDVWGIKAPAVAGCVMVQYADSGHDRSLLRVDAAPRLLQAPRAR
jgi:hypothetical protein